MDSFFFNITNTKYKTTRLLEQENNYITRVDISNGIVFFNIDLEDNKNIDFNIRGLDRMIMITSIQEGKVKLTDQISDTSYLCKKDEINIFCSSRQDFNLQIQESKKSKAFILFIADFFLKRYLSFNETEPLDFLYNKIQEEVSCKLINTQPIDALSLYIINKIIKNIEHRNMNSIKYEHNVIEFIIHRLSLLDVLTNDINEEAYKIAKKAKTYLLNNYVSPPNIHDLAHYCATNESKLKIVFKEVYKITIYNYIQKLRLEKANILLKDKVLNIGEIAKDVGYKHQGHFSKLFFQTYGVYPKDLLKN